MTREDVKKLFPEATEEQVTGLLNQTNSELAHERGRFEKLKADTATIQARADEADVLQAKIDEIEQAKLSDVEKVSKELEKANKQIAELTKAAYVKEQKANAAIKFGISAEKAEEIIKEDGSIDFDILGAVITEKETAAALAKEKEIAANSANPGGGSTQDSGTEKTGAEKIAEKMFSQKTSDTATIISQYGGR